MTIMNHQSVIDILAVAVLWVHSENVVVIGSRHILYWYQPFAICLWLCGAVFLEKKTPANARRTLNQTVDLITNRKVKKKFYGYNYFDFAILGTNDYFSRR